MLDDKATAPRRPGSASRLALASRLGADGEDRASSREISRVKFVALRVDHLLQQRYVSRALGLIRRAGRDEIVDELLSIVQLTQHVLRLLELANGGAAIGAGLVRNLHRVAELLYRNACLVRAIGKVDARSVIDRRRGCGRALVQGVAEIAAPRASRADTPGQRAGNRQAMIVEHFNHTHCVEPLEPLDELAEEMKAFLLAPLTEHDQRRRRVRHARLEVREQREADIRIADAAQRSAKALEARGQLFDRLAALWIGEQRQQLAHATGRDARIVNARSDPVENARERLAQRMNLMTKQRVRRNEFKHITAPASLFVITVQRQCRFSFTCVTNRAITRRVC